MYNTWLGAGLRKLSDGCNINRKTRPYKPFNEAGLRKLSDGCNINRKTRPYKLFNGNGARFQDIENGRFRAKSEDQVLLLK
jgi:hypothetical protein